MILKIIYNNSLLYMNNSNTKKRTRCKNGTRKNKKTGNCESVMDHTCAICLDRIITDNVKTKCKHNFHKKCLIGWCKGNHDKPTCPVCRNDIKDTCKKIMPFDSREIFRYLTTRDESPTQRIQRLEQVNLLINHKNFDPNIKNIYGNSLLYVLSWNKYSNKYFKKILEDIFKKYPNVEVSTDLISDLIGSGNTDILQVYKKYKKIPKHLKTLV